MDIMSPSSYFRNSTWLFEESRGTIWTAEENKQFENALALFDQDTPDRWLNVATMIPGKSVNDVVKQYRELLDDVRDIEAGIIPIPGYATDYFSLEWMSNQSSDELKQFYAPGGKRSSSMRPSDLEKKKGIPWTEEEHRQFLLGLKKYGKGDWRNISRNFVTTRTPTQVASHAQKYFIRQLSGGKDKRRSSIHDITTVHITDTKKPLSPKTKKHPSPDDHHIQPQVPQLQQQQSNMNQMAKALYQWAALPNQGSTAMAFDLPNSSPMMASFYETSAYEPQYGHYGTVFQGNC